MPALRASQPPVAAPVAASRVHCILLALLIAAFLFRVGAQAVQAWRPVAWLPPFESWHSATLPYSLLLASQLVILAVQFWVLIAMLRGRLRPRKAVGVTLLVLGAAYFGFMLFRLVAGLTLLRHVPWFDALLPTEFHLVLAAFLLVLADFHLRFQGRAGA
ncbi:MAG TPA: hypothetical protein VFB68_01265 [Xanthobacteraceae bacterium]|nr:hypothetical protein [Xanthobacteraceae bacterium]